MCDTDRLPPAEVLARLAEAGLDSVPGTAAGVLDDGVRQRIEAPTSCRSRAGWRSSRRRTGAGLRSTVTVMFGHVETPRGWPRTCAWCARCRNLPAASPSSCRSRSSRSIPGSAAPTGSRRSAARRTSSTPRRSRLALGRAIPNLETGWVKMGLDAATEALRWGVDDLGRTLMEESISRMAGSYHGVKLEPGDLIGAAHRAGRPAAERTTLYGIRRRYELAAAA